MSSNFNLKVVENYQRILSKNMVWSDGIGDNLDIESEGKEGESCDSQVLIWKTEYVVIPLI